MRYRKGTLCKRVGCWNYVKASQTRPREYCSDNCAGAERQARHVGKKPRKRKVCQDLHTDTVSKNRLRVEENGIPIPTTDDPKLWNIYHASLGLSDAKDWNIHLKNIGLSVDAGKYIDGAPSGKGVFVRLMNAENRAPNETRDQRADDDLMRVFRSVTSTSTNREADVTSEKQGDGSVQRPIKFGRFGKNKKIQGYVLNKSKEEGNT